MRTRLDSAPRARYQYSSMGILLVARIAERISGSDMRTFVDRTVFQTLNMKYSAQGLGRFKLEDMVMTNNWPDVHAEWCNPQLNHVNF
jgi:CubicO group peptidase (beta-lactamase class C family)